MVRLVDIQVLAYTHLYPLQRIGWLLPPKSNRLFPLTCGAGAQIPTWVRFYLSFFQTVRNLVAAVLKEKGLNGQITQSSQQVNVLI